LSGSEKESTFVAVSEGASGAASAALGRSALARGGAAFSFPRPAEAARTLAAVMGRTGMSTSAVERMKEKSEDRDLFFRGVADSPILRRMGVFAPCKR
jgi:hypothetical protein